MLKHRLPTGAVLIALSLLLGWLDALAEHRWNVRGLALALVMAPIAAISGVELASMLRAVGGRLSDRLGGASAVAGLVVGAIASITRANHAASEVITPLTALWLAIALVWMSRHKHTDGAMVGAAGAMLIFMYLGLLPSYYLVIRQRETIWTVITIILTVKSCDIGAYFVGSTLGRRKLIPWLSPGKTWVGLLGGLAVASLVSALIAWLSQRTQIGEAVQFPLGPLPAAGFGALLAGVGQAGDLAVSLFKRDANQKDTSARLPGMGGVLDVIDSLIFVAPAAAWILIIIESTL